MNKCLQGVTAKKKLGEMAGEGTSGISTAPSAAVLGGRQQKERGEQTGFLQSILPRVGKEGDALCRW